MTHYLVDYTFLTAISHGWGLAIRCVDCKVDKRWSDSVLADKFIQQLDEQVAKLDGRLKCKCGQHKAILSFYQAGTYEGAVSDARGAIARREADLRERARKAAKSTPSSYAGAKMRG